MPLILLNKTNIKILTILNYTNIINIINTLLSRQTNNYYILTHIIYISIIHRVLRNGRKLQNGKLCNATHYRIIKPKS